MKNLWKVIISGIAIGIAFLMLGYIGIYYLSGENIFVKEITELGKIEILQSQLLITGISGMLISLSIYYLEKTMIKEDVTTYKVVLGAIFLTISGIATIILIQKMNEGISDMMVILSAAFVSAYALLNGIRTLWYDIKEGIKQKQEQNTEKGN